MERKRTSLDSYDMLPPEMRAYLRHYGRHFNRKMYEFAVEGMYKENRERFEPLENERYEKILKNNGIKLDNDVMCDGMFVMSMAMSDFLGSSLENEQQLARFVKDYIDDPDQVDGFVFNRFYADCVLKGMPIDWEEML